MDGRELHARTAARCEELPGAELTHPFGDEWDVYKVRGKVFMLQSALDGVPIVNLKASPADGRALRESHTDITPGYHMNKRHWITVRAGGRIDPDLLDDLVTESYLLVVANLPKYQRPVNPETFGQTPEV
ncbi:MmcQ/YjbR family DNA-binding protein [Leucobacter tardus]|uniref:MmcQ/YjbR family DNA-binding protein n=1 Tax=Leucobacter tardus TaxID=501483 RepID=UPI0027DE6D3A|nr:MmcQ/YjbR family DNA-binding protein [Leucobacter tardus]